MVMLLGCSRTTKIFNIGTNPDYFDGKEVTIAGTVGDPQPIPDPGEWAYWISDGSPIIVISPEAPPLKGSRISIKGKVVAHFTIVNSVASAVIMEIQRY
jgi:hypothetical protein